MQIEKYSLSLFPSHAISVTKVLNFTSTSPHCSWSLSYNSCIMPFIGVEAKECIEHVGDKEEEIEDDRGS